MATLGEMDSDCWKQAGRLKEVKAIERLLLLVPNKGGHLIGASLIRSKLLDRA